MIVSKINVVLLFGGRSSEHSISCATAAGVMVSIDRSKYNLIPVGITRDGHYVPVADDSQRWALKAGVNLPEVVFEGASVIWPANDRGELLAVAADGTSSSLGRIDVVFPVLHGPFGEDGTLQGFLELLGVPYVGNGVFASAAGMDKEFAKALFLAADIPVTPHAVVRAFEWANDPESVLERVHNLGSLPLFVKPARGGSSLGVSKVTEWEDFADAMAYALEHDNKAVIEAGVVGREVECAVLSGRGGGETRVSIAGEIKVKGRDFYDFEAKYRDEDSVDLIIPAEMEPATLSQMQALAKMAFSAIGGRGLARVDFFLTETGFILNEVNTMPGFTPLSMFPSLWQESGIGYPQLIDELIELALEPGQR